MFVLVAFSQFPLLNPVTQQIFCHSVRLRGVVSAGKFWRESDVNAFPQNPGWTSVVSDISI